MQGTKRLFIIGIAVVLLAVPTQAMAQSPTNDGYDNSSVEVVDPGDPADPVDPGSSHNSGGLPFTGVDVGLLVAIGAGLAVLGFGLRRLTRRPGTA